LAAFSGGGGKKKAEMRGRERKGTRGKELDQGWIIISCRVKWKKGEPNVTLEICPKQRTQGKKEENKSV